MIVALPYCMTCVCGSPTPFVFLWAYFIAKHVLWVMYFLGEMNETEIVLSGNENPPSIRCQLLYWNFSNKDKLWITTRIYNSPLTDFLGTETSEFVRFRLFPVPPTHLRNSFSRKFCDYLSTLKLGKGSSIILGCAIFMSSGHSWWQAVCTQTTDMLWFRTRENRPMMTS